MGAHSLEAGPRRLAAIAAVLADLPLAGLVHVDDDGRVLGLVSEADLPPKEAFGEDGRVLHGREGSFADAHRADAVTAGDLMTTPAMTVAPDVSLARAARIKARDRVKRPPVVDRTGFPLAVRLARAVPGVVDVRCELSRPPLRPDSDPHRSGGQRPAPA
ncbi:CBS domain-containing protein [Streptomyces collinus]|uniref:CBS domain-containing protein n=1 Tax=Streptomyces collinus (strain DSM 40733 / Tue 365) TaxID=1214242 RepID=S5VBT2_STRC3|nr:CBS domain-containing protein [Streptomyces collinus]AGS67982.1 hypothetical protein B446_05780 [Streptomyces collinus Tu 365]UJA06619.1 CBS domain-containing protein [Streptomyces collinus]UJA12210.1 CBS domain-containing protein [Streptomyces collinus]UJA12924.1 CBS domain-containing protein [Streptomyces collinus]UJA18514.1 CBS domain-containing protein [Streptomyces collinus]